MFPRKQKQVRGQNSARRNVTEQVRRMLSGQVLVPSELPPSFPAQPWNNMTVIIRKQVSAKVYNLTPAELLYFLKSQAGFNGCTEVHFDFRIKQIRAWATSNDATYLVIYAVDFSHDTTSNAVELARIDSNAMRNMYARVGYRWPSHLQNTTLSTASSKSKIAQLVTDSTTLEIHLDINWRGAESAVLLLQFRSVSISKQFKTSLTEFEADDDNDADDIEGI